MDEDTIYGVLSVVGKIPLGKVATYGQIAKLSGFVTIQTLKPLKPAVR